MARVGAKSAPGGTGARASAPRSSQTESLPSVSDNTPHINHDSPVWIYRGPPRTGPQTHMVRRPCVGSRPHTNSVAQFGYIWRASAHRPSSAHEPQTLHRVAAAYKQCRPIWGIWRACARQTSGGSALDFWRAKQQPPQERGGGWRRQSFSCHLHFSRNCRNCHRRTFPGRNCSRNCRDCLRSTFPPSDLFPKLILVFYSCRISRASHLEETLAPQRTYRHGCNYQGRHHLRPRGVREGRVGERPRFTSSLHEGEIFTSAIVHSRATRGVVQQAEAPSKWSAHGMVLLLRHSASLAKLFSSSTVTSSGALKVTGWLPGILA